MKRGILLLIILMGALSNIISSEKDSLDLKLLDNLIVNYETNENEIDTEKFLKTDNALKIIHATFAGITYAGFLALDGIGAALLYYSFTDENSIYYKPLKFAHLGVAIPSLLSYAVMVAISFTKLGIKLKNKYDIRKTHVVAAVVSLSVFLLETVSFITIFL